jgi:micrococcal nuclease
MRKPKEFSKHPFHQSFDYRGVVKNVVDGDTIDVFVDLGLNHYAYITVRLKGIDVWEIRKEQRPQGLVAKERVQDLVLNKQVFLKTFKDTQSFGRYVAEVFFFDSHGVIRSLGDVLREEGHEKV